MYYGVKVGKNPGIYEDWKECQKQVLKYPGAKFKKFTSYDAAKNYVDGDKDSTLPDTYGVVYSVMDHGKCHFVACLHDPNKKEENSFISGVNSQAYASLKETGGEIEATINLVKAAIKENIPELTIYHSCDGTSGWGLGNWRHNTHVTKAYYDFIYNACGDILLMFKSGYESIPDEIMEHIEDKIYG